MAKSPTPPKVPNDKNSKASKTRTASEVAVAKATATDSDSTDSDSKNSQGRQENWSNVYEAVADKVAQSAKDLYVEAGEFTGRLSDRARKTAQQGKDKAAHAVGSAAQILDNKAPYVGEKYGARYGRYTRRTADKIASMAEVIDDGDIDDIADSMRRSIRKNPLTAMAVATMLGFIFARMTGKRK